MTPAEVTEILRQFNLWRRGRADWSPSPILIGEAIDAAIEMIDRLEAAEKERDKYKAAYNEWCEKSEWIQEGINNREISPKYLGWHLADIALDLLKEHKEKCDDLQAKVEQMERPSVPKEAIAKILTEVMDIAVSNGADSRSMPDEYVEVAAWLCGTPGAEGEKK